MPVISAAAGVFVQIGIGEATAVFLAQTLVSTALSYGIGFIAQKIGERERDDMADAYSIKSNSISNVSAIPVIYGERIVGGTEYRAVTGNENEYLWRVMVLAEGEIDDVTNVYLNDHDVDNYANNFGYNPYENLVDWWWHSGTEGQSADSNLVANLEDWSVDHRGYGVAYLVVRIKYDQNVFTSMPTLTAKVRGRKVYDPRDGTTAWSDNPALCIRDYLTNTRYGRGIDDSFLDDTTFIDAANHCDESVTVKDSDGNDLVQARYTCNGVVNPDDRSLDILQDLCTSCRGVVVPPGEKYKLRIDRVEAASFAFTDNNIIGSWTLSGPGATTLLNRVNVRFFDAQNNWDEALQVVKSDALTAEDNGRIYEGEIGLPFTNQIQRADIIGQHHVKQSRQGWRASFTAPLEAIQCEVMDVVSITHEMPGWDEKLFRIHGLELLESDVVNVTVQEYDPSVYTFDLNTPPAIPDTNLPDPFDAPPPSNLTLESGTEHLQISASGSVISRMLASWAAPASAFVRSYEVGYKLSSSSGWTTYATNETQHYFAGVADGYAYDVRVRVIYYSGMQSEWAMVTGHVVIGKTAAPAAPTSFSFASQRDYTREFSWTLNTVDPDVAGYKIRFSTTLTDDWEDMTALHDGLLLSSPWETNLLNAGTYRFGIKTVDTSGNESSVAKYMQATLEDSPASSILAAFYPRLEGWPGTITNGYVLPNSNDIESTDSTTWDDLATDAPTWDDFLEWGLDGDPLTYQFSDIDFGAVITFRPIISAQADGSITYQIDYSSDGSTWNGWTTPTGDITCRYLRCRITVTGTAPRIQSMTILIDGEKEIEDISDLDTSTLSATYRSAAGDIRLPITTAFTNIKTVSVTLQNTGPGWSWELIDKTATVGPRIKIYDNTGTLADATIDAIVKGY
jgi:hypothetical protein